MMRCRGWFLLAIFSLTLCNDDLHSQLTDKPKPGEFLKVVDKQFKKWDRNKDGQLTREELEPLIDDADVRGEVAAALVVLHKSLPAGIKPARFPLTWEGISKASNTPLKAKAKESKLDVQFREALTSIRKADRRLFGPKGPSLLCIHQGGTGDCYALAALGAYLHRDTRDVVKLFQPQKNGRIRVAFAHGPVEILPLTDAEFALSAGTSENTGCWVRLFEKAVGTANNERRFPDKDRAALATVGLGGEPGPVMGLLTGNSARYFDEEKGRFIKGNEEQKRQALDEIRAALKTAQESKRLLFAAARPLKTYKKVPGIPAPHAYAVLDYNASRDVVRFWNPWGSEFTPKGPAGLQNGYPMRDGIFEAPLSEAMQFMSLGMETTKPLPKKKAA